jgi:hypothetical protein
LKQLPYSAQSYYFEVLPAAFPGPVLFLYHCIAIDAMARKIIGYYNDSHDGAELEGFEVFALEKETSDWSDIFYEVKAGSEILNRSYRDTVCYYNFEESVMVPQQKFTTTAAEDYLSLVYGESNQHDTKYDTLTPGSGIVNAYRIRRSIHELVGRHFVLYKPHHSYSRIVDDILTREQLTDPFVKIQFYSSHIIVAFVKNKQLQLVRSFRYQGQEDILYYVLSIVQQYGIKTDHSHLELSGAVDETSTLYLQLSQLFGQTSFENMPADSSVSAAIAGYPAYYFTPFYKLAV